MDDATTRTKGTDGNAGSDEASSAVVFAHANGFTPGAYRQFLQEPGSGNHPIPLKLAPLSGEMAPTRRWDALAEEVGSQVDSLGRPVVGIGHSLGATLLLLTAAAEPRRFRQLVLIEPIALPALLAIFLRLAPGRVRRCGPLAQAARKRVDRWSDRNAAFAAHRQRRRFGQIPDRVLLDMVEDGLVEDSQGVTLRYTKEWEATLYESPPNIWPLLRRSLPPILLVRGAGSDLFDSRTIKRWQQVRPHDEVVTISGGGHLLPLERPQETAAAIGKLLQQ